MGKDSLLESTSKKKAKTAPKKGKAAKKAPAAKSGAHKKSPVPTAAKPSPAPAKPPTRRELLAKKFDLATPAAVCTPPPPEPRDYTAPSFFAGMSAEAAAAARTLLHKKFDWAAIQAAGEAYEAELAARAIAQAEEAARRKAEEEARRKAEEEAQRKAQEEAQRRAQEEARRRAAVEAKRKAEEEARRQAEEEALRAAKAAAEASAAAGGRAIKLGALGVLAIFALLIAASYANTRNFYITAADGAVEIRRGIFAPMGTTRVILMPGQTLPAETKESYTWKDAYTLMHQFYIDRADALLEVPGVPDTAGILANLEKALHYATDKASHGAALGRMATIRMQILIQRAEAAQNRRTIEDVRAALEHLQSARDLRISAAEMTLVEQKIAAAEALLAELQRAQAEAAALAAEQQALEKAAGQEAAGH